RDQLLAAARPSPSRITRPSTAPTYRQSTATMDVEPCGLCRGGPGTAQPTRAGTSAAGHGLTPQSGGRGWGGDHVPYFSRYRPGRIRTQKMKYPDWEVRRQEKSA